MSCSFASNLWQPKGLEGFARMIRIRCHHSLKLKQKRRIETCICIDSLARELINAAKMTSLPQLSVPFLKSPMDEVGHSQIQLMGLTDSTLCGVVFKGTKEVEAAHPKQGTLNGSPVGSLWPQVEEESKRGCRQIKEPTKWPMSL